MSNCLEYRFLIKRISKSTNEDYISALKIYNETTPPEIKTNTNEITYWLENNREEYPFEVMLFSLYLNDSVIGLAMVNYIKKQKIIVFEYLALQSFYRSNAVFFTYLGLIQNYINDQNIDVSYYITEINNRNNGENIDKESKIFKRLLCLENYGKINAQYYSLPLGLYNYESHFESVLYIKTNDNLSQLSKETYIDIVRAIYFDYYITWYQPFMTKDEYISYQKNVNQIYDKLLQDISSKKYCEVSYIDCPLFNIAIGSSTILPVVTKPRKKQLALVIPSLIICPIFIVVLYIIIFNWLGIQLNNISVIIGNILSAAITAVSTIFFIKKS